MSFVVFLVGYFLQQKMDWPLSLKFDRATLTILRPEHFSIMAKSNGIAFSLLILILLAYFSFFYVLFFLIETMFYGAVSLLLQIIVLLLVLGQKGFKENLENYLKAWKRGDFEAAAFKQQALSGVNARLLRDPVMMQNEVSKALLYHNFNRFFVVMFWFMVAGPAMIIVVRVADLIAQHSSHQLRRVAVSVNSALEWLPARLLALTFTLTGDFKHSISGCARYFLDITTNTSVVLGDVASSTLDSFYLNYIVDAKMDQGTLISTGVSGIGGIRGLLSRSMALWLGICAISVIFAF